MCECSICIEDIEEDNLFKTTCGHHFHKECIYEWIETRKKYECPLCRTYQIFPNIIRHKNDIKINNIYCIDLFGMNCIKRVDDKQFVFNDIKYNFPIHQLKDQIPCAWISDYPNIENKNENYLPIYKLYNDDGTKILYIDFHLRQLFLRNNTINEGKIVKHINVKDNTYYLSSIQSINIYPRYGGTIINRKNTALMVLWIYDIIQELKDEKKILTYELSINSIILDLALATIYYLSYRYSKFQLALMCSVYNCLKLYYKREVIKKEEIKDYTVNLYDNSQIDRTNEIQTMLISNYVELI